MAEPLSEHDRTLLNDYIEKIRAIDTSMKDLRVELSSLMKDADADEFDGEALRYLAVQSSLPRGKKYLEAVARYGQITGAIEPFSILSEASTVRTSIGAEILAPYGASVSKRQRMKLSERSVRILQLVVGVLATGTFLWLLR